MIPSQAKAQSATMTDLLIRVSGGKRCVFVLIFRAGHFKKGLYEGAGVLTSKTGSTHDGLFKRGVPHGYGTS